MGLPGEAIAELTKFGWVIVSLGKKNWSYKYVIFQTSLHDCEKLCSLDCLSNDEERRDDSNYVWGI